MKIRKIIIIIILFLLSGLLFIVGSISYESGVSYGESNAEEIRASKIKNVSAVVSSKFANVQVVLNKAYPVIVSGSGRVRAGTMINISSEVQGLLNSPISLKKGPVPICPPNKKVKDFFNKIGTTVEIKNEKSSINFWTTSGMMAPFYELLRVMTDWLVKRGVKRDNAQKYITSLFLALS